MRPSLSVAVAAKQDGFRRLCGCVHDDSGGIREQLRQFGAQFLAQLVVQVGQRLVEQHQPGLLHDGPRERDTLLLTSREFQRLAVEIWAEAQKLHCAGNLALDFRFWKLTHFQRRGDVLAHGPAGVIDELLIDHRDIALGHGPAGHVLPIEPDFAPAGTIEPRHHAHKTGLAGKRGAEKHVERAALKPQRYIREMAYAADQPRNAPQLQHQPGPAKPLA